MMGSRTTAGLFLTAFFILSWLSGAASAQGGQEKPSKLDRFVNRYLNDWYRRHPGPASMDGIHSYDGMLERMSAAAIASELSANREFQRELAIIGQEPLTRDQQVDFQILDNHLKANRYNLETVRMWERSPLLYSDLISNGLLPLILFDALPAETRLKSLIAREKAIPRLLAEARTNLTRVPRVFIDPLGIEYFEGTRKFIERDIPRAFEGIHDASLRKEFADATDQAVCEIASFIAELRSAAAASGRPFSCGDDDFALGPEVLATKLKLEEGIEVPIDWLFERSKQEIQRSRAEFKRIAANLYPGLSPLQVWERLRSQHPEKGHLVEECRNSLTSLIRFIEGKNLLTLPPGPLPMLRQTPTFLSSNTFASVYCPGVFETAQVPSVYYVTDAEPEWSVEEQEQHLREYAWPVFWTLNIHEAYPGHFVQGVAMRRAPSRVRMAIPFASYAFCEGWAHYCEQMIIEEGFRADDPTIRLGLLKDGLLRLCRWTVGIGLHTRRMTVEEAVEFFMKNAFMEAGPARDEALRGTYDPQYILYSIGKLALYKLRDEYRKARGLAFSLKDFHDRVLGQGNAPIWVLRQLLLPATATRSVVLP